MVNNLTNLTNGNGFYDLVQFSNQVTNDLFVQALMVSIFFILMMMFLRKSDDFSKALLASSYLCFFISIPLVISNLLNYYFWIVFLSLSIGSSIYVYFTKGK